MEEKTVMTEETVLTNNDPVEESNHDSEENEATVSAESGTNVPAIAAGAVGVIALGSGIALGVKKFKERGGFEGVMIDIAASRKIRKTNRETRRKAHDLEKENQKKAWDDKVDARVAEKTAPPVTTEKSEEAPKEEKVEKQKKGK